MHRLVALFLCACSPVQFVPLAEAERKSLASNVSVDVVVTGRPTCAYDEIGLLRVEASSLDKALQLMRDKARDIGAPQLILRSPTMPLEGRRAFEAIAVMPDCERLAPSN